MSDKYEKNAAQILLRYSIDRGLIVIPKSINRDRIRTNAEIFDFSLTSEEMENLEKLNCDFRVVSVGGNRNHKYYPFRENYAE